jgi:hypothetical protein
MMWLTMPAFVGAASFAAELAVPASTSRLTPLFCVALVLWATLFAEYANRLKEILVFRWGGVHATATDALDEMAAGAGAGRSAGTGADYRPAYRRLLRSHGVDADDPDPIEVSARVERTWRRRLRFCASGADHVRVDRGGARRDGLQPGAALLAEQAAAARRADRRRPRDRPDDPAARRRLQADRARAHRGR